MEQIFEKGRLLRGSSKELGSSTFNSNGYESVKVKDEQGRTYWKLRHQIVYEEKVGRQKLPTERLFFIDGNNQNFDPKNIGVKQLGEGNLRRRRNYLLKKIEEAQKELEAVEASIAKQSESRRKVR